MSYIDRKNILSEGLIDKIISVLTKKKKIKDLTKAEMKARGIKSRFAGL